MADYYEELRELVEKAGLRYRSVYLQDIVARCPLNVVEARMHAFNDMLDGPGLQNLQHEGNRKERRRAQSSKADRNRKPINSRTPEVKP